MKTILVFDIEVMDVINKDQARAEVEAKKMERKLCKITNLYKRPTWFANY